MEAGAGDGGGGEPAAAAGAVGGGDGAAASGWRWTVGASWETGVSAGGCGGCEPGTIVFWGPTGVTGSDASASGWR